MRYYKIIKDNVVIDVNYSFFRLLPKSKKIIACEFRDAELIQSSDQEKFYTVNWLRPLPENPFTFEQADAAQITEEEYNTLYEKLKLGATIQEVNEEIEAAAPEISTDVEKEEEQIMDLASMRKRIADLEAIIKQLLNK